MAPRLRHSIRTAHLWEGAEGRRLLDHDHETEHHA